VVVQGLLTFSFLGAALLLPPRATAAGLRALPFISSGVCIHLRVDAERNAREGHETTRATDSPLPDAEAEA
jgi:hypothetical protein